MDYCLCSSVVEQRFHKAWAAGSIPATGTNIDMDKKFYPLVLKNLIAFTEGSVGSESFRNLYFETPDGEKNILRGGELSCAFFVSSVLKIFSLIGGIHTTVSGAQKDLIESGWEEIKKPRPGVIILWTPQIKENGESHRHLGFYVGDNQAVHNDGDKRKVPVVDLWNYRPVEKIYWNKKLE